jgi:hypothetical protein
MRRRNPMLNVNPLPVFESVEENFSDFPLHVMDTATRTCVFCGEDIIWETHAEYLAAYAESYEGAWLSGPYDPQDAETFDFHASACNPMTR